MPQCAQNGAPSFTAKRRRWKTSNASVSDTRRTVAIENDRAGESRKCSGCRRKFSVTSSTLFQGRKLAIRDYLAVIALFANGVKGVSALQMSRNMNVGPKSIIVKQRWRVGIQTLTERPAPGRESSGK